MQTTAALVAVLQEGQVKEPDVPGWLLDSE
ncbi:hypothetical protein Thiosp_00842 [Thiorhodovibrio litoralis]|nr:hypothetical protein Thiosp_00842 [Thiorhodovibrio litoralis]